MPVLSFQNVSVTVPDVKGPKRYLPVACQGEQNRREVLHNVSGCFPKKGLVAIMGPSGSGKTTFLNAVSNRMSIGGSGGVQCSGVVRVNGQVVPSDYFYSKSVSFVPQDTCLFSELTPRESIRFSTSMIFPHLSTEEIEVRTTNTIASLNLQKCADSQIGNEMFRGVSGGEKKRTSIGVAIVNEPSVLFLDEPTTGLDTETASIVVRSIQGLSVAAKRNAIKTDQSTAVANTDTSSKKQDDDGRIIIMTLHQPSSDIWDMIDHLVLLVQGYIVYNGPAKDCMNFFVSIGFKRPLYANPADHFLDIVQCQEDDEEETSESSVSRLIAHDPDADVPDEQTKALTGAGVDGAAGPPKTKDKKQRAKFLSGAWKHREKEILRLKTSGVIDEGAVAATITEGGVKSVKGTAMSKRDQLKEIMRKYKEQQSIEQVQVDEEDVKYDYAVTTQDGESYVAEEDAEYTGWWKFKYQLKVLTRRSWTTFTRTKLLIPLKLIQIFITAILIICLFSPLGHDQVSVLDRSGCMYLVIIVQIFATVLSVVMLFPEERGVYLSEQAARLYDVMPYFLSKLIIDIPILTITIFGFSLLVYFPVGLQATLGKFLGFFFVLEAVAISGHGLGLIVASLVASPAMAALLAPMAIAPFILFSHVAIPGDPSDKIIAIMRPIQVFSPFWWGLDALMATEMVGLKLGCNDNQVYAVPSTQYGLLYICQYVRGEEVLQANGISENAYPLSLFMLFLIATICIAGSAGLLKVLSMKVASTVSMDAPREASEVEHKL